MESIEMFLTLPQSDFFCKESFLNIFCHSITNNLLILIFL